MIIIPAIDLINGKCVRLSKGNYNDKTIYHEDPVVIAKQFEDAGLQRLHLVDLDGAKRGSITNLPVLKAITKQTNLIVDFSGGIKNIDDVRSVFDSGASIVTLGSVAVRKPELISDWIEAFGEHKILIGADVLDEKIKISGWLEDGGITIFDFIKLMMASGVKNLFCTDISKDGMMEGVSGELYKKIVSQFPNLNLFASGGVTTFDDITALEHIKCAGVIVGKAIYEGNITLKQLAEVNTKINNLVS